MFLIVISWYRAGLARLKKYSKDIMNLKVCLTVFCHMALYIFEFYKTQQN